MNLNIRPILDRVDPFIGTAATDLPAAQGLAAAWWWPKAQVGNTHPGACYPLGMVSACAYSGAYPTGYGRYGISTEGAPEPMFDADFASGFTHFQQSGTGAIRKYYNYFRTTPMIEPLDALGTRWKLEDETAEPGYYAATLENGIRCELTAGPKTAVHRYTFPAAASSRVVVDFSHGGLAIEHGSTVPLRAELQSLGPGEAQGTVVMEGVPLSVFIEADAPGWRQLVWYDRRRVDGGTRLDFDHIRRTTLRPFGIMFMGPTEPGQTIELRMGFSLRGTDQARENLRADLPAGRGFDACREDNQRAWAGYFDQIKVDGGSPERQTVFATGLYHSLIKPCFAAGESPFWPAGGPFVFDISTMWDMYKTQFPLLTALSPEKGAEMLESLVRICEEEGNLPIGYRMARGTDRFFRQASALAHTALADGYQLGLPGLDWEWALVHMQDDLRRGYGEEFAERGIVHPISHTLDLAYGYWCTALIARGLGDAKLAAELEAKSERWTGAFNPADGLLRDSSFYEGGRWNYSFRLLHDMAERIALCGGDAEFCAVLDRFFGYGAEPVTQLGVPPFGPEHAIGTDLNRFEGLNNEPDMEAPWAYHYAGRPARTAEIVHAALAHQFGTGPGGLPGNDDSGGLSSWYVWASLGLFPVAGQNLFLVNAPAFAAAQLRFGGNDFQITTTGHVESGIGTDARGGPQYVQHARFNGRDLDHSFLTGDQLHGGGTLEIELGPSPSTWATKTRPPSASDRPAGAADSARGGGARYQEFLL